MLVLSLFCAPGVAFVIFDFVFPNLSTPSLGKNMMVAFLLAMLFGMVPGYLTRRTDLAIVTVILYVFIGYLVAIIAYSAPFTIYDFSIIFPGLYFLFFLNMTVILIMLLVLGGFIGVIIGQLLGESMDKEETAQNFAR